MDNTSLPRMTVPVTSNKFRFGLKVAWSFCLAAVIAGSLVSGAAIVTQQNLLLGLNDKVLHFCAYGVLAFLPYLGFNRPANASWAALGAAALSLILEGLQLYVPGRTLDAADLGANCAGIVCGAGFAAVLKRSE